MNILLEAYGYTGQLIVTDQKIIIKRKGLGGFIARGILKGDKEIPIKNITAIEFKNANWLTNGRIQFSIHGELGHKGGAISAVNDENTLLFTNGQKEVFIKAKQIIDELMSRTDTDKNKSSVSEFSIADELKKFAELKERGIISQEEFDKKKTELLNK